MLLTLRGLLPLILPGMVCAFQYGVPYTFQTQAVLAESGRTDTGWYFAARPDGGTYPRTATVMREGGFSALISDSSDATGHTFWTVQDRGLNASYDAEGASDTAYKIFAFPGHHQKLMRIRVQDDSVITLARDSIGGPDAGFITGLPTTRVATAEVAVRMRLDSAVVNPAPPARVPAS